MAILQALLALIAKSAGKILNAIFGWAVRALFGRTSAKERTFLSGLVAAAAAWPLLLFGVAAPRLATLLLAFVPIPRWVPSWTVRAVWLGLVVLVPLAIGIAISAKAPPTAPRRSLVRKLLSGFPITIGLATAFVIMFVTVPVMRLWSLLRGQSSADIPLVTEASAYHRVAALAVGVLNRHGFDLKPTKPGWWVAAPARVLRFFGGDAFGSFVPERLENYGDRASALTISFYPSGVLLRGKGQKLTWAHGLVAETTARGQGFQTSAPAAQDIETQIKRLWKLYEDEPEAHVDSPILLKRVDEIAHLLGTLDVDFEDWQVVYRQLLQLERGLRGQRQLLEAESGNEGAQAGVKAGTMAGTKAGTKDSREVNVANRDDELMGNRQGAAHAMTAPAATTAETISAREARDLSTVDLVKQITSEVGHLAQKQIELAKTELRADLKAEATTVGGLGLAAWLGLTTLNLLLVTAIFALAQTMAGWMAGLVVSGFTLVLAGIVALVAWNKRVRSPMARTRRTVSEDIQWSKERLV